MDQRNTLALGITRPENALLLCSARTTSDPNISRRLRGLVQEANDWDYVIRAAHSHGVAPLLYWNLRTICPEIVPKPVLIQLERLYQVNEFNSRFLARELVKLSDLFAANEIPTLAYKGPALAAVAYGNLAFRQFSDLDILIHKRDLSKAQKLLVLQGYQLDLTSEEEEVFLKDRYHFHFVRDGRVHVEIHWAFTRSYWSFPIDYPRLWERLEPVAVNGALVSSFHPEDLLLILCAHAAKHYWERLAWICDVAEVIRAYPDIRWERVVSEAIRLRSDRILLLGLKLSHDLLGAIPPASVLARVNADSEVDWLSKQVQQRLFADNDQPPPQRFERSRFYLRMRECWKDKLIFWGYHAPIFILEAITPNEKDRALMPLPDSLNFLQYPLRPLRLIKEYGFEPLKNWFKRST